MELKLRLAPQAKLEQKLSPRLAMFYRLLQLNTLELQQAIQREVVENPALELVESVVACPLCGGRLQKGRCERCGYLTGEVALESEADPYYFAAASQEEDYDQFARLPAQFSLQEHLSWQVRLVAPEDLWHLADALIEHVDEDGYFRGELESLARDVETTTRRLQQALHYVQQCEPSGVGARDLQECLALQLRQRETPEARRALKLVLKGWDLLSTGNTRPLARRLKLTFEEVEAAVAFIQEELNPYPGRAFRPPWEHKPTSEAPLAPEVAIVETETGDYTVEVLTSRAFGLRLSPTYLKAYSLLESSRNQAEREHVRAQLDRARLFLASLNRRTRTLKNVTLAIVSQEKPFLKLGEEFLRPLTRRQVAELVKLHESTVSRCVANKHALLPKGTLFALARFFDRTAPAKSALASLLRDEPREKPYSDQKLAQLLSERFGLECSRRTVAKYRQQLGLPDRATRRNMYRNERA